eukprot:Rmarinus@m.643
MKVKESISEAQWNLRKSIAYFLQNFANLLTTDFSSPLPDTFVDETNCHQEEEDSSLPLSKRLRKRASALASHAQENFNPVPTGKKALSKVSEKLESTVPFMLGAWISSALLWLPYLYPLVVMHVGVHDHDDRSFHARLSKHVIFFGLNLHEFLVWFLVLLVLVLWTSTAHMHPSVVVDPAFLSAALSIAFLATTTVGLDAQDVGRLIVFVTAGTLGITRGLTLSVARSIRHSGLSRLSIIIACLDWIAVLVITLCNSDDLSVLLTQGGSWVLFTVFSLGGIVVLDYSMLTNAKKERRLSLDVESAITFLRKLLLWVVLGISVTWLWWMDVSTRADLGSALSCLIIYWIGFSTGIAPALLARSQDKSLAQTVTRLSILVEEKEKELMRLRIQLADRDTTEDDKSRSDVASPAPSVLSESVTSEFSDLASVATTHSAPASLVLDMKSPHMRRDAEGGNAGREEE